MYDTEWDEGRSGLTWKPRWPQWLVDFFGADYFGNVVFINLHDRGNDKVLSQVARLKYLKQLHRPGLAVSDAGLAHVGRLSDLQLLSLENTHVTDAGLAHLKGLAGLKWLKLGKTSVTDAGVATLRSALPRVQILR